MDQATPGPTRPTTPGQPGDANDFRVECGGLCGSVVYLVGHAKTNRFLNRDLAVSYAQQSTRKCRPSLVIVIEADGRVVGGWEFPLEAEKIAQRIDAPVIGRSANVLRVDRA